MPHQRNLFIVDVDGCLTDGCKTYPSDGLPVYKNFYDKDFTALKEMTAAGFEVVWLSGDDFINQTVATNRGYKFLSARGISKKIIIEDFISEKRYCFDRVITIGDDIFDLCLLDIVNHFYLPSDASWRLKLKASIEDKMSVLSASGGKGAISEVASIEISKTDIDQLMPIILKLDQAEKF